MKYDRLSPVRFVTLRVIVVGMLNQLLHISKKCIHPNGCIDPAELQVYVRAHYENLALGKPFSPPHPRINPADSSLSFVDDCGHPIDESMDCADVSIPETQP